MRLERESQFNIVAGPEHLVPISDGSTVRIATMALKYTIRTPTEKPTDRREL